nr:immunoglobulin light chain junction region [Macaca mulatta]
DYHCQSYDNKLSAHVF